MCHTEVHFMTKLEEATAAIQLIQCFTEQSQKEFEHLREALEEYQTRIISKQSCLQDTTVS